MRNSHDNHQKMNLKEYDKFVIRFVNDYVNNLSIDEMKNHLTEQFHMDIENIRLDTGIESALIEMENWDYELYEKIKESQNV